MKEAATKLEWEEDLKFDGIHCLRHGIGQTIREIQGYAAARNQLGHTKQTVSMGATGRYVRSNDVRLAGVTVMLEDEDVEGMEIELDNEAEKAVVRAEPKAKKKIQTKNQKKAKTTTTKVKTPKKGVKSKKTK